VYIGRTLRACSGRHCESSPPAHPNAASQSRRLRPRCADAPDTLYPPPLEPGHPRSCVTPPVLSLTETGGFSSVRPPRTVQGPAATQGPRRFLKSSGAAAVMAQGYIRVTLGPGAGKGFGRLSERGRRRRAWEASSNVAGTQQGNYGVSLDDAAITASIHPKPGGDVHGAPSTRERSAQSLSPPRAAANPAKRRETGPAVDPAAHPLKRAPGFGHKFIFH
jgi:hypothetical protein